MITHIFQKHQQRIANAWSGVVDLLFGNNKDLKDFKPCGAEGLQDQWNSIVKDYETRHSESANAAGYETHPDPTPYMMILLKIYCTKEITFGQNEKPRKYLMVSCYFPGIL